MAEQPRMSFCWHELMTPDAAAATKFYGELLGWTVSSMTMDGGFEYFMFTPPGAEEPHGGMMELKGPQCEGVPPNWMMYVAVPSITEYTDKAKALGAEIKVGPTPVPGFGTFSVIQDPTGAVLALWESARQK